MSEKSRAPSREMPVVAALIVSEAGGRISRFDGSPYPLDDPGIVASNGLVHDALIEAIST
jgi:fructose-1,6-bisphosphatase/inositol monophosphatase family enzyme